MKHFIITLLLTLFFNNSFCKNPVLLIKTTEGNIKIELFKDTPFHTENFLKLVKEKYYDGMLFHRVIKDFMIQTGDPNSITAKPGQTLGYGGPDYTIPQEFKKEYYHKKGAISAARQPDNINPTKSSSGSQFFIVQGTKLQEEDFEKYIKAGAHLPFTDQQKLDYMTLGGTPHLDYQYTVFGQVIEGLAVVDKISSFPVDKNSRPFNDVKIISITLLSN